MNYARLPAERTEPNRNLVPPGPAGKVFPGGLNGQGQPAQPRAEACSEKAEASSAESLERLAESESAS